DQFMQAFDSLLVRYPASQVHTLVAGAVMARPDLANRIRASAARVRPVRGYSKDGKDFKEYKGKEIAAPECQPTNQWVQPYIIPSGRLVPDDFCEIAADTAPATVAPYAVQRCCSARRGKNHQNRQIECAGSTDHSVHTWGRHWAGYLGGKCPCVRCCG